MWTRGWREAAWRRLEEPWDLLVIGGGITGAGILYEAARTGVKALLVEQRDFAWGTSSRSSKLVHGGLRYLRQGDLLLTRASVRERERLIEETPGLVEPLGFLAATRGDRLGGLLLGLGLSVYDVLAGRRTHRRHDAEEFRMLAPHLAGAGIDGGYSFRDARTDDARLVLRLLRDATSRGAAAVNYAAARRLLRAGGRVAGAVLCDTESGRTAEVKARVVINAAGAWSDRLREQVGGARRLRPLRGSHLVFPAWRLPAPQALMLVHPADRRPLTVLPWEGATLVGTTDLDHERPLDEEPRISPEEADYLMAALRAHFPSLDLSLEDAVASFAGVRPVVGTGRADPSREARDHVVWEEQGLLTVTGGKLTTFRLIARDALEAAGRRLPPARPAGPRAPAFAMAACSPVAPLRLLGRHGDEAAAVLACAGPEELAAIPGTHTLWAELRWAARAEGVVHLEDLLLRRVRLGLLLPQGGLGLAPRIRAIAQPELGWDHARWEREEAAYRALWSSCYGPVPA